MNCTSFSICKPELRASRSFSSLRFPVHAKLQEDCNSCTSQNSHIRLTHPCPSSRPLSCSQLGDSRTSHPCKLSQLNSQLLPLSFRSCVCHYLPPWHPRDSRRRRAAHPKCTRVSKAPEIGGDPRGARVHFVPTAVHCNVASCMRNRHGLATLPQVGVRTETAHENRGFVLAFETP